jgi:cysteinyl-tRNA synthetase
MSKSTGNFLTLKEALEKFSADGKHYLENYFLFFINKFLNFKA